MLNFWSAKPIAAHQAAETFFGTTQQLTEAIARSAIPAEEGEYGQFRADVRKMAERMSLENPSETLVTVGSLGRALEEYNGRVGRAVRQYQVELRGMVGMLTDTVTQCSSASDRSKHRLQAIEHRLEKAQAIEDIRLLKLQLAECLESLREESAEQRKEWEGQIHSLSSGLAAARKTLSRESETAEPGGGSGGRGDHLTGLPRRQEAMEALSQAMDKAQHQFAVLFVVDRVDSANSRFGFGVGDQMLLSWQQLLHTWFGDAARIFRWSGPAFLMLLQREAPPARVRAEVAQSCSNRQEKLFNVGNRSVLMVIAASHLVMPLAEFQSVETLALRADTFVRERSGQ